MKPIKGGEQSEGRSTSLSLGRGPVWEVALGLKNHAAALGSRVPTAQR